MLSKVSIAVKYMFQLGLRPLILYGMYKLGLRFGWYGGGERIRKKEGQSLTNGKLAAQKLFALPDPNSLEKVLGEGGKRKLVGEADEIINGTIRVFGDPATVDFGFDIPLKHWTLYETDHSLVSSFLVGNNDIKYLWEPARFAFVFSLGRAYHLTKEDKYAVSFWKHFESFALNNPANTGPHWMNGQEVAIRMMALVWAYHVFERASCSSEERRESLIQSIYEHANRIPPTLIYARSQNNNHLTTESAAIYTAGLFFKNEKWRRLGWKWLNWSFQHQIGGFGEYIQHSVNYHRVMLHTALWVNFIKRDIFSADASQSLARSAHWLFSILDNASGSTPNLGANDGALIFPLTVCDYGDYRPTVQAASRAFLRESYNSGIWDEMSLWFGLRSIGSETDSNSYLTDNLRAKNSWGYLRASSFKSRLSHMDQLHFDLWHRGLNVAQDAGTYSYNADAPWDNPLMTSRVHNVVSIKGADQMTRAGKFLILDWASAFSKPIIEPDDKILQKQRGYFTGYRKYGVSYERSVAVYQDEFWEIEDRLLNWRRRSTTFYLHWLLIDGKWRVESNENTKTLFVETERGQVKLILRHPANFPHRASLVRAGELIYGERDVKPYEGWVSRHYGQKSPALSFALEIESQYHLALYSEFSFE